MRPHHIVLNGCTPVPLIHYLKALGIFRLVAEQCDPQVRGAWCNDAFALATTKMPEELDVCFISSLPVIQRPACMAWADKKPAQIVGAESQTTLARDVVDAVSG